MARLNPSPEQRDRLFEANAFRCCVCKRRGIGLHLHHIDGDSSNTVDENLAVLCVQDHDRHHRPGAYEPKVSHLELDAAEIARRKQSWEAFVAESRRPEPKVIATLAAYGTEALIHSLVLVLQWPDERIEHQIAFHLLDGDFDRLTDQILEELAAIAPKVKLAMVNGPLPIEHCPCCGTGFRRTLKPAVVTRLTDPTWKTDSSCSIYINPDRPSLAITVFLRGEHLMSASLHLCQGKYLHYSSEGIDDPIPVRPRPSIRSQATQIVQHFLGRMGTGEGLHWHRRRGYTEVNPATGFTEFVGRRLGTPSWHSS